ncbi:hypothetical protein LY78DRAFT_139323 [Colletotrichum sublineola]|nr:hypothetical protein LY78DRAFT_139323 [Colletotrichum sublineola]
MWYTFVTISDSKAINSHQYHRLISSTRMGLVYDSTLSQTFPCFLAFCKESHMGWESMCLCINKQATEEKERKGERGKRVQRGAGAGAGTLPPASRQTGKPTLLGCACNSEEKKKERERERERESEAHHPDHSTECLPTHSFILSHPALCIGFSPLAVVLVFTIPISFPVSSIPLSIIDPWTALTPLVALNFRRNPSDRQGNLSYYQKRQGPDSAKAPRLSFLRTRQHP